MVKSLPAMQEIQVQFLGWEDPLGKEIATPVSLPRESHGQRSLVGYSSWGPKEGQVREGVPECDQLMHNSLTG